MLPSCEGDDTRTRQQLLTREYQPAGEVIIAMNLQAVAVEGFQIREEETAASQPDHPQVTRCKEGGSLQAVETWGAARPHYPTGRGQSQVELIESPWLTVELSHCGAAMSWFRVEGEKQNEPQPSKHCASLRTPLSHSSRCRRYLCADLSQIHFALHHLHDLLHSCALSPK